MKRFCCALIILTITITSAAVINHKIITATDEMLNIIENNYNKDKITNKWNENKMLFSLILTQTQIEKIQTSVNNIRNNVEINHSVENIKNELNSIKDSMKLNIENVF